MTIDDSGYLLVSNADGSGLVEYQLTASGYSDMEGITVADASDPEGKFYVAVENPPAILEFKYTALSSGSNNSANRVFVVDIPDVNAAATNQRLEGLSFVPWAAFQNGMPVWLSDQSEPALHGIFYIALQSNGCVYAVSLAASPATSLTYYNSKDEVFCSGNSDLAALHFDACHNVLYGANDGANLLRQFSPQGQVLNTWPLAGDEQEGVGLYPNNQLLVAQDTGAVCRMSFNPFTESLPNRCSSCGNGNVEAPENCDDGNFISNDGCENDCSLTITPTVTASPTVTQTPTPTPTRTASPTATLTPTAPPTPSPTVTPTPLPSASPSATPTNIATPDPTHTSSPTETPPRCKGVAGFLPRQAIVSLKRHALKVKMSASGFDGVEFELKFRGPGLNSTLILGKNNTVVAAQRGNYRIKYRLVCATKHSKFSPETKIRKLS